MTGELADLAAKAAAEAAAVLRNGRRALPRALSGQVRDRCSGGRRASSRSRWSAPRRSSPGPGPGWPGGRREDSPAGEPARPRCPADPQGPAPAGPLEFGYQAQVTNNDHGIALDYSVEYGAAPDGPQLAPAVERVARRAGRVPQGGHRRPRV